MTDRTNETSYLPWLLGALLIGGGLIAFAASYGDDGRTEQSEIQRPQTTPQ